MIGRTANTTRTDLLGAATRLILERGAASVTLEAVAKEAEVSKGGLLYHFPNKDALVEGLLEHYAATFYAQVTALAADEPATDKLDTDESTTRPKGAPLLRAYVRATFAEDSASRELGAAVLGAVLLKPALLHSYRERLQELGAALEQGTSDPTRAAVVRLAVDGLWFSELLGVTTLSSDAREALEREMLALLDTLEEKNVGLSS